MFRFAIQHRRLAAFTFLLVFTALAAGGIFLAAEYQFRAAERDLDRHAFAEAQRGFDWYLRLHPSSARAHLLAAQAARRRDAYGEAEQHLDACIRLEGMAEPAALERLLLAAQQGDLGDIEAALKKSTGANDPYAGLVLEALAKGYLNRFWMNEALECLNRLLEREPKHVEALLMRARVWEDRAAKGEQEHELDALHDYEAAIEIDPTFTARLGLAGTLFRLGRPWDAAFEFERLHAEQPAEIEVLYGLARCRYSLHDVDEARRLLDEVLEAGPNQRGALLERGRLALHEGLLDDAEQCLSRAVAVAPEYDCEPLRLLHQCLQVEHKDNEAQRCFDLLCRKEADVVRVDRRMLQANRDPRNVALHFEVAMEVMGLEREQEGVAALFVVLELEPAHRPAHVALADYFERTGQRAREPSPPRYRWWGRLRVTSPMTP
jgi:tetratricopeptide (TPR) repeat protein